MCGHSWTTYQPMVACRTEKRATLYMSLSIADIFRHLFDVVILFSFSTAVFKILIYYDIGRGCYFVLLFNNDI
jgi:hypothetical protein